MAALTTDYVSINRGGTPGVANSGDNYVTTIQGILDLVMAANAVSSDAGQLLTAGADGGALLTASVIAANESLTSMSYDPATKVLSYTDEAGITKPFDLSALAVDLRVDGASIDVGGIITFSVDDDGTATDFTLDMSSYINSVVDNEAAGTITVASGASSQTISKTGWMAYSLAP